MKFRPVMLLWMAVLFAAAPAWADRVPCCVLAKVSPMGISADFAHGVGPVSALFGRGSEPFTVGSAFSSSSFSFSREGLSSADLRDLGFLEPISDHTWRGLRWSGGHGKDPDLKGDDSGSSSVPEPGSLSLLLVGLTVVGVFARKR